MLFRGLGPLLAQLLLVIWMWINLLSQDQQKPEHDKAMEIETFRIFTDKGEIASAFGDLMKNLWAPGATPVAPRIFKSKLAHFAPQFSGFNQHDSQELLAFLLDGLHEDLNRVKDKPYVEAKDGDGRPDEEVADEYWNNHLAQNDSIIVDVCQGQYRSTLVCPDCKRSSVTFDPFMYVSLPLPSTSMRTMTLTVVCSNGSAPPSPFTINVPKRGKFEDLIQTLSTACSIGADETLLVAEVYSNWIIRFITEPTDSLSLIRDNDRLVAYKLPKNYDESSFVVFKHQQLVDFLRKDSRVVERKKPGKQKQERASCGSSVLIRRGFSPF